jgi:5-formyltetrahydrofolate cyclo-ligase
MIKAELRKIYLQKRQALGEEAYDLLSRRLCDLFYMSVDFSFIKTVHIFLPMREKREPDTWLIIDRMKREFPHIRLSVPKVNNKTRELENFYFEDRAQLVKSKWGIEEPGRGVLTPSERIDMVLVPLLCVDTEGHRVGYGGGYYDKFLIKCLPSCRRVGISLFEPIEKIDDINGQDVPLDALLAPSKFFTFEKSQRGDGS